MPRDMVPDFPRAHITLRKPTLCPTCYIKVHMVTAWMEHVGEFFGGELHTASEGTSLAFVVQAAVSEAEEAHETKKQKGGQEE